MKVTQRYYLFVLILCYFYQQRSYSINANVRPSVCLSVRFRGKRDFHGRYIRQSSHFLCTFLLYMSIYSTNILSVGLSVRLQKSFATMDVAILVFIRIYFQRLFQVRLGSVKVRRVPKGQQLVKIGPHKIVAP